MNIADLCCGFGHELQAHLCRLSLSLSLSSGPCQVVDTSPSPRAWQETSATLEHFTSTSCMYDAKTAPSRLIILYSQVMIRAQAHLKVMVTFPLHHLPVFLLTHHSGKFLKSSIDMVFASQRPQTHCELIHNFNQFHTSSQPFSPNKK